MSAEIEPPELASLVGFAERPRVDDWSLRAAMVRCAQPEPERASVILDLVRRTDGALQSHGKTLQADGAVLWASLEERDDPLPAHRPLIELLRVASRLDRLGELLAAWAADWPADRPDGEVDAITAEVASRLDELGIQPEEPPPNFRRGRG